MTISEEAFIGCDSLTSFVVLGTATSFDGDVFGSQYYSDPDNLTIVSYPNTPAQRFADSHRYRWMSLDGESSVLMFRLYNRWTGEHFYTATASELENLAGIGWNYEGVGWIAPRSSFIPVYRLYNQWTGDHHYTTDATERDDLVVAGWTYESVGWYSDEAQTVPLYRQYNSYAKTGTHNYTTSIEENNYLVSLGWVAEGIGWYGV